MGTNLQRFFAPSFIHVGKFLSEYWCLMKQQMRELKDTLSSMQDCLLDHDKQFLAILCTKKDSAVSKESTPLLPPILPFLPPHSELKSH